MKSSFETGLAKRSCAAGDVRRCSTAFISASVISICAAAALAAPPAEHRSGADRRRSPVVEVFEQCRDAVVNISTTRVVQTRSMGMDRLFEGIFDMAPRVMRQKVQSVGSGVVIHPAGYVVTNAHVVAQASDVQVTFSDGKSETADIVAVDAEHDLAVLKINGEHPFASVKLGHGGDIMVGETVVAIGNPLGLQHTVTAGIVSALGRDLVFNDRVAYKGLIQTDASINPGNSGGPLLNIDGELIGINTAIRGDAQNIGFAISVDRLWETLPSMLDIERRERVQVGLRVSGLRAEVEEVRPGSPAAEAGVKAKDEIVRVNGDAVRDGIDYYVRLLGSHPGEKLNLAVKRGGRTLDFNVPLKVTPLPDGDNLARQLLGVKLTIIPSRLRRSYDMPGLSGMLVEEVERNSPARSGLEPGDVIRQIEQTQITSLKQVGLALEQVVPGEPVEIELIRFERDGVYLINVAVPTRK
jgi:serine protease Do